MTNILRGSILMCCIAQAVATNANANGEISYQSTALHSINAISSHAWCTVYVNAPEMTKILRGSILFCCIAQAVATNANANGEISYKTTDLPRRKPIIYNNKPFSINTVLNLDCTVLFHLLPTCLL